MAEDGVFAASQHRCRGCRDRSRLTMADGVHAGVSGDPLARLDPAVDRAPVYAESEQLRPCGVSLLRLRQLRDLTRYARFFAHTEP
jgi:hypothetical protein